MSVQTDGRTYGRTDRQTDRRTDGHPPNDPEHPKTLCPLEYSSVSPLFLSRINTHTETNTASANAGCKKYQMYVGISFAHKTFQENPEANFPAGVQRHKKEPLVL